MPSTEAKAPRRRRRRGKGPAWIVPVGAPQPSVGQPINGKRSAGDGWEHNADERRVDPFNGEVVTWRECLNHYAVGADFSRGEDVWAGAAPFVQPDAAASVAAAAIPTAARADEEFADAVGDDAFAECEQFRAALPDHNAEDDPLTPGGAPSTELVFQSTDEMGGGMVWRMNAGEYIRVEASDATPWRHEPYLLPPQTDPVIVAQSDSGSSSLATLRSAPPSASSSPIMQARG